MSIPVPGKPVKITILYYDDKNNLIGSDEHHFMPDGGAKFYQIAITPPGIEGVEVLKREGY